MRHFQLTRPLNFFESLDRDFDRFFAPDRKAETEWKPYSRVREQEDFYLLSLDIPGVDKEYLKVELKDSILSISGERKDRFKDENTEVNTLASFDQRFSLPKGTNLDEIEVHQENGVLDVLIPKTKKEDLSKTIEVKTGRSQFLS